MPGLRAAALALLASVSLSPRAQTALTSPSPEAGGAFGYSVAGIGDVDGDGVRDVLVGAPGESHDAVVGAGRVYIMSGATQASIRTLTSPTPIADGAFGFAVDAAGDLNSDGTPDVLVGAPGESDGGLARAGKAYVLSGSNGAVIRTFSALDLWEDAQLGYDVARVGDQNGDGTNDHIVGAPGSQGFQDNPRGVDAGAAYVFNGASASVLAVTYAGGSGRRLGTSVGGGDFDANTLSGYVVGSPLNGAGTVTQTTDARSLTVYRAPDGVARFGQSLDVIGDRDNMSMADVVIGSEDGVFVYAGSDGGLLVSLVSPDGPGDGFGFAVSGAGNVDEEGAGDLIVGAHLAPRGATPEAGRVFLFTGDDGDLLYSLTSPNPVEGGHFGHAVALAGEIDDDNTADQIVGAPGEDVDGQSDAGRAYLLLSATVVANEEAPGEVLALTSSPNPARSTLRLGTGAGGTLTVVDALGREVHRAETRGEITLDVSEWAPGAYHVRLATEAGTVARSVTIVR
ncbi:MAG: FG-GAP-like repeat-containing protein [Bacteroidota bacterium]